MIVRPKIEQYATQYSTPEHPGLKKLAEETRQLRPFAELVGPLEGRFLAMLVHALRPRLVVEIGTHTGFASLWLADALPPGARLITCAVDPAHAEIARRHIAASPAGDRVELRVGSALDTLAGLDEPIDLAFIDGDRRHYASYYEAVFPKVALRGLIVASHILLSGRVITEEEQTDDVNGVRKFNELVRDDPRVEQLMMPVWEGVTVIRKVTS